MAFPVREEPNKPLLGRLVYLYGSPVKSGVIIDITRPEGTWIAHPNGGGKRNRFAKVLVKWLKDGSTSEVGTESLNDYEMLVKDHERKLITHKARLAKLKDLT